MSAPRPRPTARTLGQALQTTVALDGDDAAIYRVAETLCGGRRPVSVPVVVATEAPATLSPPLSLAIARLSAVAALRTAIDAGADRDATILRGPPERRRRAPLALTAFDDTSAGLADASAPAAIPTDDDEDIAATTDEGDDDDIIETVSSGAFDDDSLLVMSGMVPRFLARLAVEVLPRTVSADGQRVVTALGRTDRQALKRLSGPTAKTAGDHLIAWTWSRHLKRLDLNTAWLDALRPILPRISTWVALATLDTSVPLRGAQCVRGPMLRLIELLGPGLGQSWVDAVDEQLRFAADAEHLAAACRAIHRQLTRVLEALDHHQRLDLLEPLLVFSAALPRLIPDTFRGRLARLPGVRSMAQRDQLIEAVVLLFAVVDAIVDVAAPLRSARYGDDRFLEGQLVRERWESFEPLRPAIAAARHTLLGTVEG